MVESTRIVLCVVDSTNWKGDLQDTYLEKITQQGEEGASRKSGRIDSIRLESSVV